MITCTHIIYLIESWDMIANNHICIIFHRFCACILRVRLLYMCDVVKFRWVLRGFSLLYSCDDDPSEYWELFPLGTTWCSFFMCAWFSYLLMHYIRYKYIQYKVMSHDYVYNLLRYFIFLHINYIHSLNRKFIIFLFNSYFLRIL